MGNRAQIVLLSIGVAILVGNCAATASAAVSITSTSEPTPGLAGFKTYSLTASSEVAGEFISVVDFIGDKDNTNPVTARGFFGPMNQLEAGGPGTTVFNNFNFIFPNGGIADSQFKESSNNVIVAASKESPNSLRAGYAYANPSAQSLAFAQLTVADGDRAGVNYRGVFSVMRGGTIVDLPELTGCVGICSLEVPPYVPDVFPFSVRPGEVVNLKPVDITPGTPPVTWSELSGPTYTPGFGERPGAPGLGSATWTWNPATQAFQFKSLGATAGTYVWTGMASNAIDSDHFAITVNLVIPEPASLVLISLAALALNMIRVRGTVATHSASDWASS